MKKIICIFTLLCTVVQIPCVTAYAQRYEDLRFQRPMQDAPSGKSFRKGDESGTELMQETMMRGAGAGMALPGGSMMGPVYQVHVLGEVKRPGTYRVTASERLSEVLQRAGGIATQGSERNIELRRRGGRSKRVDLMEFKIKGDLTDNPYLMDNDVVYVPLKGKTVQVLGAINRPMEEYELRGERTLGAALELAGGYSVGVAKDSPVRIIRFVDGEKNIIQVGPNKSEIDAYELLDGDVVFVPHVITERNRFDYDIPKLAGDNIFYPSFEDRVFILGGVRSPGAYPFNPYYSMAQYLSLAGGNTRMASGKFTLVTPSGKRTRMKRGKTNGTVINPGDTIVVHERRMAPEAWIAFGMGVASFGLSATATVLALTR